MQQTLEDFYKVVRSAGVKISPSDSIETSQAVSLVGYRSRNILKNALVVSLAKSIADERLINECFDQFFTTNTFRNTPPPDSEENVTTANADAAPQPENGGGDYAGESPLARMLLARDTAGLNIAMRNAARAVGLTDIWFFTQKSLYTQQIMQHMGLRDIQTELTALGESDSPSAIAAASALRDARAYLFEEVRDFVEQQLSMFGRNAALTLREDHLKSAKLSNIEQRDFHIMHDLVRKIAQRLSTMYAKKRKRENRGQLDFRKTLRNNVAFDGTLFDLHWKRRYIDKPRLLVLCDVSGSVQAYARFLLLLLYSLSDVMQRIDCYVFTGNLVCVDDIFDHYPVQQAIEKIMHEHGTGGSNYGTTLLDLEDQCMDKIDNKTTLLILGDARNNNLPAHSDVLQMAYQRAKRVIWLNPEPENFWKTGDSVMLQYRPYCHTAKTCNTLHHLEMLLDNLLRSATSAV